MEVSYLKKNLREYQNIPTRCIQYTYNFLCKRFSKWIVPTLSYPAVYFQTVMYAMCKTKIKDTIMSQK